MTSSTGKAILRIAMWVLMIVGIYVLAASAVFDMTKPALPFDEEEHNGRPVAYGPRPRAFCCRPTYHDFYFTGEEWPFKFFRPMCEMWRTSNDYERPSNWRNKK
jgi:hypothetical protein